LESTPGKNNVYRIAKQMAKSRQDPVGINYVKRCKWKSVGRKLPSEGGMQKIHGETAE